MCATAERMEKNGKKRIVQNQFALYVKGIGGKSNCCVTFLMKSLEFNAFMWRKYD